ncbi:hypothetical protein TQ32_00255 [Pyrococcus kukulkanii]|uniref:Uncharacterized protein n=1 Tax=Pyrococcus kukulkanii TaxID=1609559 RepID=A0A127B8Z5_9EURY|nr:hypothetical protein TQ32_00255 [Pyrococcus kukulkanii]
MVILILMVSVSQAMEEGFVLASAAEDPYKEFWDILYREADLVVQLNKTGDGNIAKELINNSRRGAENAANISSSIWIALQELKKSGVKLYYTEDELRKMAEDIKRNGLPQETVKALKEQGWTDSEIKALEEYIAENADKIRGDFDMGEFLLNMSRAFIAAGFKYNYYETWALKRWLWTNPKELPELKPGTETMNPLLAEEWMTFMSSKTIEEKLLAIEKLQNKIIEIVSKGNVDYIENGGIVFEYRSTKERDQSIRQDSIGTITLPKPKIPSPIIPSPTPTTNKYYWPTALEAYRTAAEIRTLLLGIKYGNGDRKLEEMLRNRISDLRSELKVYKVFTSPSLISPFNVEKEGKLSVEVKAIADEITTSYVRYHLKIILRAKDNDVYVSKIKVNGTGLSFEKDVDLLVHNNEDEIIETEISKEVYGEISNTVKVKGKVEITYSPIYGSTPTLSITSQSSEEKVKIVEYSKDFELEEHDIDPKNVSVKLVVDPNPARTWENVKLKLKIRNDNEKSISGVYQVKIAMPDSGTIEYTGSVTVNGGTEKVLLLEPIEYSKPGMYSYLVSFKFGDFLVMDNGSIKVIQDSGDSSSQTLEIMSVEFSPSIPRVSNLANVIVKVKTSTAKTVKVELMIDGEKVASQEGQVNGERNFILPWRPQASGEHEWVVYLYERVANNKYLQRNSESGKILVASADSQFAIRLYASPRELNGGGEVIFSVKVWNYGNDRVSLKGFVSDGDGAVVKNIDWTGVPANAQNYTVTTFTLTVYGVGEHKYKLFLDNYDGQPNGKGEEHWSEVTVEVRPMNGTGLKQISSECDDVYFDFKDHAYRATLSCRVYLHNSNSRDEIRIRDIAVLNSYSLGDLENMPAGSLNTGEWSINPSSFTIPAQTTKIVHFNLPLEISPWIPISVADATEVVLKDGEFITVEIPYTLGYSYDENTWTHFSGEIYDTIQVKMDTKTVATDYVLSGVMAVIDPNTAISFSVGSFKFSGIKITMKLGFDPWAFVWNGFLKPYILEHT